jgi:hypothetical protein
MKYFCLGRATAEVALDMLEYLKVDEVYELVLVGVIDDEDVSALELVLVLVLPASITELVKRNPALKTKLIKFI